MNWLAGWGYRKSHTINPASGAGTDYVVKIKVYYNHTATFSKYTNNPLTRDLHPDVHYFPSGIDGYKYWMVDTPYPPENVEHPVIKRSNDGITWTEDGVSNPVINTGWDYDADPDMIYVSDYGKWFMVIGSYNSPNWVICLFYSSDGKTWSAYSGVQINGNTNPVILSALDSDGKVWEKAGYSISRVQYPTLIYESGTFTLFYGVNRPGNQSPLGSATFTWNDTTEDIENFQRNAGNPIFTMSGGSYKDGGGHFDISKNDGTYYLYCIREKLSAVKYEACYCTSSDKVNWTYQGNALQIGGAYDWDEYYIYRTVPVVDGIGNQISFDGNIKLYYSAYNRDICASIGLAQNGLFNDQVDLGGNCKTDFGDIRFTSDDKETELNYWLESKIDGGYAIFWLKISADLSSESQDIYIYYGKSDATTTSNIINTFTYAVDGNAGNFTEENRYNAEFSYSGGYYKMIGSVAIGDAWATGILLDAIENKCIRIVSNNIPTGSGFIHIGLWNALTLNEIVGTNYEAANRHSVCYGNGIFVAMNDGSTYPLFSDDGFIWQTASATTHNAWQSACWANTLELFVAVASSGTGDRVMTSPDGITWTYRTSAADNSWQSICWSETLSLLVAVSATGTGNRVMTSPDGITWTSRTSAADNYWTEICDGNGILVSVAYSGNIYRAMSSTDGINWVLRVTGDIDKLYNFYVTRQVGATSTNIIPYYRTTGDSLKYWRAYGWDNSPVSFQTHTGTDLEFKIWTDDTNIYLDILQYGHSILMYETGYDHEPCTIPIADVMGFGRGVVFAIAEPATDTGYVVTQIKNATIRKYVSPEPEHDTWGIEETSPSLTLTYPNGGETLYAGDFVDITWTNNDLEHLQIYLSTDNGSNWTEIKHSILASLETYSWLIEDWAVSTQCLVKIIGLEYPDYYDASDAVFTINEDITESVTLNNPNGGETYYPYEICIITWESEGLTNVQLLYSINNGDDWTQIVASVSGDLGTYNWTVPAGIDSTQCLVKVIGVEKPEYWDVSDGVFTIKTDPLSSWTQVATQLNSQTSINALAEYGANLYGGTSPDGKLFIFENDHWAQIADQLNEQTDILCLLGFKGNLYAGTAQGGRLFRLE